MRHHVYIVLLLLVALLVSRGQSANVIPPEWINPSASSEFLPSLTGIGLTIDKSGLTGDLHDNHPQGHSMWLSGANGGGSAANNPAGIDCAAWVQYEFAQPIHLESAWVWNHNQQNLTDRGLKSVSVHVYTADSVWKKIGDFVLTRAPGTPDYAHGDTITFPPEAATRVLISCSTTDGNYGADYYGLSEIRFYGTPGTCVPSDWPVQVVSIEIDNVYTQVFSPQAQGWLGSDVSHSIPLGDNRLLWLYGDTLIGEIVNGARAGGAAFINNSIAIQDTTQPPIAGVEFFWGAGNTSFFPHQSGTPGNFYWPTNGILLGDELFLFCYSVLPGGPFGFMLDRTTMIRISNPGDSPTEWTWQATDFGVGGDNLNFHSAIYVEEPYVYFLGTNNDIPFTSAAVLARMTTTDLLAGSMAEAFEYWVGDGEWSTNPDGLRPLFRPSNTETHFQYVPEWERFFVTTYNAFAPEILLTTSKSITGPWEDPVCIYDVPEHLTTSFPIISYAVRTHPELSTTPGELVISYATNSLGELAPLFTPEGLGIYHPRFIRVQLAQDSGMFWMIY